MGRGRLIERVVALDESALGPLLDASLREGWRHLERLVAEWRDGTNRFAAPGEAVFVARDAAVVVGFCGVTADPYARKAEIGRLRRLYVDPAFRRGGIGSALVARALEHASIGFRELRLRTSDSGAAAFFDRLGFERVTHLDGATHRRVLAR